MLNHGGLERRENIGCADKVAPEELREASRERIQQISRHEWAVLEQRREHVVRKIVLVHYGPASGINLPECDQPAPDSFGLRDLCSDHGIVPCLAKETALCAVDHLPLSIKVRCTEEGGYCKLIREPKMGYNHTRLAVTRHRGDVSMGEGSVHGL